MNGIIKIEYPESLAISLKLGIKEFESEIKASSMIKLFELGKVSSGTAAKVLGITRIEFLDMLAKYNVSIFSHYDSEELSNEIANA